MRTYVIAMVVLHAIVALGNLSAFLKEADPRAEGEPQMSTTIALVLSAGVTMWGAMVLMNQ